MQAHGLGATAVGKQKKRWREGRGDGRKEEAKGGRERLKVIDRESLGPCVLFHFHTETLTKSQGLAAGVVGIGDIMIEGTEDSSPPPASSFLPPPETLPFLSLFFFSQTFSCSKWASYLPWPPLQPLF